MPISKKERNEKIIELKDRGLSYGAISKMMHISRARVHQIYSGYSQESTIKYRNFILKVDNYKCRWGKCCEKKELDIDELIIHHVDGNDRNNELTNLITLCKKCHAYFHRIENPNDVLKNTLKVDNFT